MLIIGIKVTLWVSFHGKKELRNLINQELRNRRNYELEKVRAEETKD